MTYVVYALAAVGGVILGAVNFHVGYKLSQTRYWRGKTETIQALFSRHTFN
jgi:hypothetical protein